ncbi:fimbrial biogenesis chaperone [Klebsiella aerogenes]|nr:molecular chaperone [Klebsiella aerogenes]
MKVFVNMFFLMVACFAISCHAFMLGGYRFIYDQEQSSIDVPVFSGHDSKSYLIKAVLHKKSSGNEGVKNFLVSPPLFRLEPGQRTSLRISLLNTVDLPSDRESVFYLYVAGIPSTNPLARGNEDGFASGKTVFGTGSQVKFFYRPRGIKAPTGETYNSMIFHRKNGHVFVSNPTPYNITMTTDLGTGFHKMVMVPPFGEEALDYKGLSNRNKLTWYVINDKSESVSGTAIIQ